MTSMFLLYATHFFVNVLNIESSAIKSAIPTLLYISLTLFFQSEPKRSVKYVWTLLQQ